MLSAFEGTCLGFSCNETLDFMSTVDSRLKIVDSDHRRSKGLQCVHLHAPGRRKNFLGVIYRENL